MIRESGLTITELELEHAMPSLAIRAYLGLVSATNSCRLSGLKRRVVIGWHTGTGYRLAQPVLYSADH